MKVTSGRATGERLSTRHERVGRPNEGFGETEPSQPVSQQTQLVRRTTRRRSPFACLLTILAPTETMDARHTDTYRHRLSSETNLTQAETVVIVVVKVVLVAPVGYNGHAAWSHPEQDQRLN